MLGTSFQNSLNLVSPRASLCLLSSLLWGRGGVYHTSWLPTLLIMRLDITYGSSKELDQSKLYINLFLSWLTLFFSIKDKTGNVFGGLVVDKEVTSPHKSDFYLQSHPGLKGSKYLKSFGINGLLTGCPIASRPSHYIVLYNKLGFSIDMWVVH